MKSSPWPAVPYGYDAEPKERPDVEEVEDADEATEERDGAIAVGWLVGWLVWRWLRLRLIDWSGRVLKDLLFLLFLLFVMVIVD